MTPEANARVVENALRILLPAMAPNREMWVWAWGSETATSKKRTKRWEDEELAKRVMFAQLFEGIVGGELIEEEARQ